MPSYVPPSKRKTEKESAFKRKNSPSPSPAPDPKEKLDVNTENFPSLGESKSQESTMNFASSITTVQPKKEKIKEVADGWIKIRKRTDDPQFILCEEYPESYYEVCELVENIREERRIASINRTLDLYDEWEEEDLEKYGTPVLYGWQIDDYLEEQAINAKLEAMEFAQDQSDESSDEEIYNEFN